MGAVVEAAFEAASRAGVIVERETGLIEGADPLLWRPPASRQEQAARATTAVAVAGTGGGGVAMENPR